MSSKEVNEIFSRNLRNIIENNNMSQLEFAETIGVSQQAVSLWLSGSRTPKMHIVDKICELFCIKRSDLLDDGFDRTRNYYDKETAEIAQALFENKELRLLFSAAKDASPETLKDLHDMLLILKRKEI